MNSSFLTSSMPEIELAGERLCLLAERAVWWAAQKTLLIADTHFGKEATFRSAAIPVPDQTHEQLKRLDQLIEQHQARRLIVLGDLLHARRGRCPTTFALIREWRQARQRLEIQLIRGNHDVRSGDPPEDWQIPCRDEPATEGPLQLRHIPSFGQDPAAAGLCGHLHPMVRLHGRGGDSVRLPCFLLRNQVLTLPAFSGFVDGRTLTLQPGDQVYGICEQQVLLLNSRNDRRRAIE